MVTWWIGVGWGFCGTFVGPAGDAPENGSSRIVLVHEAGATTLTMTADAKRVPGDFGMLVPIPADLDEDDIVVLDDASAIDALDAYSAPRLVSYTCDTLYGGLAQQIAAAGCASAEGCVTEQVTRQVTDELWEAVEGVDVLGITTRGNYELAILEAADAGSLQTWLGLHGYGTVEGADELLANYTGQGVSFVAARITMPVVGRDEWLPPLQIRYPGESLSLPLRLGALNASGDQDLTLWVVGDAANGEAALTTFPEVTQEADCMPGPRQDVGDVRELAFEEARGDEDGAYVVEYSWPLNVHCDPCATPNGDTPFLVDLGRQDPLNTHMTRLRVRFDAGRVRDDLHVQYTRVASQRQLVYIEHRDELEADIPVCFEGLVDAPAGDCEDVKAAANSAGLPWFSVGLLPLLGWWRRRQRR